MTQLRLTELIHEPFHCLAESFGFSVVHAEDYPKDYGNAIVVLQSRVCRLRIIVERERVSVEVGSLQAPLDWAIHASHLWFDIGDVILFLTDGKTTWEYPFPDSDLRGAALIANQIESIAGELQPYIGEVLHLFEPEVFEEQRAGLLEYRQRQADKWLNSLYEKRRMADREAEL